MFTPAEVALLYVQVEEERDLEELRVAHLGRGASERLGGDQQEADNY